MAGGDLLYIFAFIILPTAVLVSCIWALLLLRKGVLLPVRPTSQHDPSHKPEQTDDAAEREFDLVEETGEHTIVEPLATFPAATSPAPTAAAPVSPLTNAGNPVAGPSVTDMRPAPEPAASEPPAAERTQELTVLPVEVADAEGTDRDRERAAEEPLETGHPTSMPATTGEAAQSTDPASDAAPGVVIVPLDEPPTTPPSSIRAAERLSAATPSSTASRVPDASRADGGQPDVPPSALSSARRPARRITHVRSTDEASSRPRPRTGQRRSPRQPDGEA